MSRKFPSPIFPPLSFFRPLSFLSPSPLSYQQVSFLFLISKLQFFTFFSCSWLSHFLRCSHFTYVNSLKSSVGTWPPSEWSQRNKARNDDRCVLKLEKPSSGLQTFPPGDLSPAPGVTQYVLERPPDTKQLPGLWLYKDYDRHSLAKYGWAWPGFPVNTSSSWNRARKKMFKAWRIQEMTKYQKQAKDGKRGI